MENIEHEGIVSKIENNCVFVSITAKGACVSCAMKSACNPSESKMKIFKVKTDSFSDFAIGDKVVVLVSSTMGLYAVLLSYFLPVVIIFLALIIFMQIGVNEGLSALISLGCVLLYFIVLYVFRKRTDNKFKFNIRKI